MYAETKPILFNCPKEYDRPKSDKLYKLVLHGGEKRIETVGFYL